LRLPVVVKFTPTMAAGISDHVWSIEEIVGLLDAAEGKSGLIKPMTERDLAILNANVDKRELTCVDGETIKRRDCDGFSRGRST
jgi:hypothetical protein